MSYRLIILFFILTSCAQNYTSSQVKKPYASKGFAYIYSDEDFSNQAIHQKLDNSTFQIAHNKLRAGSLIKIINIKTNDSIILKNNKKVDYPEFYKILITKPVADNLNLEINSPLVEVMEVKKNKSFVAKKTKIFKEEERIHNNAPVESVIIDNISSNNNKKKKIIKDKFYIVIAEFYSKKSAFNLKKRITQELTNFDSKKLYVKSEKSDKTTLLSGPYNSVNLMKNDYIQLKSFGFEDLDISVNE